MSQCFDPQQNQYIYCSSGYGTYIAVGIILPVAVLILSVLVSAYLRHKRKRILREQQHISMTTVVPIYNTEADINPIPNNYSYPPNPTSTYENPYDKPPSYEQTVQQLSVNNNYASASAAAAVLPVTTITAAHPYEPTRH